MPLVIPDEVLQAAGQTEQEARVEIACRLFQAEKLDLWPAAQFANLSRSAFEAELMKREIPIYRPTAEDVRSDLKTMAKLFPQP